MRWHAGPLAFLGAAVALAACSAPAADATRTTTAPPSASPPSVSVPTGFVTGLTIPWAVGGERIERDGTKANAPGEWPPFPVDAIRLWDTRTAWLNLEPADDQWDWTTLDSHLAKAERQGATDVTLVLAGTPRWAAVRETADDAPWLGPGSASPPEDLAEWEEFVSTVAARYAGRIDAYEIGNEPNLATFWNGTPEEYAELVRTAAATIARVDPEATVIVNAGLVRGPRDIEALGTWLTAATGNADVDVVSVHVYPDADGLDGVPTLLAAIRERLDGLGFAGTPQWVTELNVSDGSALTATDQEQAVASLTGQVEDAGFARAYWYAWTDLGPDNLIQLGPGTPGAGALLGLADR